MRTAHRRAASREISRFPRKELRARARVSDYAEPTGARVHAPARIAFRPADGVGTPDRICFVAQWLARTLPCQRFAVHLAVHRAWLGASVVRCSFTVGDLHPILPAGLSAHLQQIYSKLSPSGCNADRVA